MTIASPSRALVEPRPAREGPAGTSEGDGRGLAGGRSNRGSRTEPRGLTSRMPTLDRVARQYARGRGGTGRRAGFRSRSPSGDGGSSPLARTLSPTLSHPHSRQRPRPCPRSAASSPHHRFRLARLYPTRGRRGPANLNPGWPCVRRASAPTKRADSRIRHRNRRRSWKPERQRRSGRRQPLVPPN